MVVRKPCKRVKINLKLELHKKYYKISKSKFGSFTATFTVHALRCEVLITKLHNSHWNRHRTLDTTAVPQSNVTLQKLLSITAYTSICVCIDNNEA